MDYGFAAPLRIVPKFGARHRCALIALHALLALIIAWHWPWSWGNAVIVTAVLVCGFASIRELNFVPGRYRAILLTSDNCWRVTAHDGDAFPAALRRHPVLWSQLILLPLQVENRATTLMLTRDMMNDDQWRRLTVRLKFLRAKQSTASAVA